MKIEQFLIVTSISLDGHNIPVPEGLSEILNRSGGWETVKSGSNDNDPLKDYEKKVVLENGRLFTRLTYKKKQKEFHKRTKINEPIEVNNLTFF
ncbi:hypothetical protein [Peribacillus loiseleuriae]|uniref:hypothetical protein n=1 Tax=Peribacillus loiseleuriae TaxID=1679170 RepID=UPI003D06E6F9